MNDAFFYKCKICDCWDQHGIWVQKYDYNDNIYPKKEQQLITNDIKLIIQCKATEIIGDKTKFDCLCIIDKGNICISKWLHEDIVNNQCRHKLESFCNFLFNQYDWQTILNQELEKIKKIPTSVTEKWMETHRIIQILEINGFKCCNLNKIKQKIKQEINKFNKNKIAMYCNHYWTRDMIKQQTPLFIANLLNKT